MKQLEEQAAALRYLVICAFNELLDLKDPNTGVHSTRLAEWLFIRCPFHGWLVSNAVG